MQQVRLRSVSAESSRGGSALLSFKDAIPVSSLCVLLNKEWAQSTSATSGITAYGNTGKVKRRRSRFTYSQRINHHG